MGAYHGTCLSWGLLYPLELCHASTVRYLKAGLNLHDLQGTLGTHGLGFPAKGGTRVTDTLPSTTAASGTVHVS